jgi:flavin reductase (DIM6/NTAB) family NADH-FMN oxidoreductase RutF
VDLDMTALPERDLYKVLAGLVVPRPVAWVTSLDEAGCANLAPFSFFQVMSPASRRIGLGIGTHANGDEKDTLRCIRLMGEFVVNLCSVRHLDLVDASSAELPPGTSEAEQLDVRLVPGRRVSVPRIRDVPASLECRLDQVLPMGGGDWWVVGEVVHATVDESLVDSALHVDYASYRPLGRLVGSLYVDTDHLLVAERPGGRTGAQAC